MSEKMCAGVSISVALAEPGVHLVSDLRMGPRVREGDGNESARVRLRLVFHFASGVLRCAGAPLRELLVLRSFSFAIFVTYIDVRNADLVSNT
jgi:hypothetical protein